MGERRNGVLESRSHGGGNTSAAQLPCGSTWTPRHADWFFGLSCENCPLSLCLVLHVLPPRHNRTIILSQALKPHVPVTR